MLIVFWSVFLSLSNHQFIMFIQILSNELAKASTVYIHTFFNKIKSDGSFHVQEEWQHHLLYWPLHPELFLYQRVSIFPFHGLSFWFRFIVANSFFLNTKTYFSIYTTYSSIIFTWFAILSYQKLDDRQLFKPGALFDLPPFWITSKQLFWRDWNEFSYEPIQNNAMKNIILLFPKKFLLFIERPLYYNTN